MNDSILRAAATIVQVAPLAALAVATVLAIRTFNRPRLRARPGFIGALILATVMAAGFAGLVLLLVGGLAGFDSGPSPEHYVAALPFGAVAFVVSLVAGFVGYVVVASRWPSARSALGALLGAPLMAVLFLGASSASVSLSNAASEAAATAGTAVIKDRSADINVRTELIEATLDPAVGVPTVASVHLRVTLNSKHDLSFETGSKSVWPRFRFFGTGAQGIEAREGSPGPGALVAGRDEAWDVTFDVPPQDAYSGTYQAPGPGMWTLHVLFLDAAGADYDVTSEVDVQPTS
jgi:hypothetical protein